ncbi:MAG: galactonate dehydratase [Methylobacteriaceae bacterium]|jgi:galactonate dehydratase|nr:galactonate dehydratase [Methylobacteriaceae bacterium]
MKITQIECFEVEPRWLFLKVSTDEGLVGWGENGVEGRTATTKEAVMEVADYLIGKDPLRIQDHWETLYRSGFYRGGVVFSSALGGIDMALWDIKGKYYNAPIHALLGGPCRDSIKVYSWIGGDRPGDVGRAAKAAVERGFTAVKMLAVEALQIVDSYAEIDKSVARIAEVREAVGPNIGIGVDFHGRVHKPMVKMLAKALEEYRPMFIEEPVLPEYLDGLTELSKHTAIPIATGERLFSRQDFKHLFEARVVDIIQPDPCHAGGISEVFRIAAMAEAYDVAVALHCPVGPIALAANLQVDGAVYNAFIQEQSLGIHYNRGTDLLDYLVDPQVFDYRDGFVTIPQGPGLGIEINEERVRKAAEKGHRWRNPVWRHADGTIAEW